MMGMTLIRGLIVRKSSAVGGRRSSITPLLGFSLSARASLFHKMPEPS